MSRYAYITLTFVAFVLATISVMYLTAGTGHAGNVHRVVNTTADHADDGCADLPGGDCTLREVINDVGGSGDLFEFNIPSSDPCGYARPGGTNQKAFAGTDAMESPYGAELFTDGDFGCVQWEDADGS